jgi:hypothetical protein
MILDENTRRVPSFAFFNAREWFLGTTTMPNTLLRHSHDFVRSFQDLPLRRASTNTLPS